MDETPRGLGLLRCWADLMGRSGRAWPRERAEQTRRQHGRRSPSNHGRIPLFDGLSMEPGQLGEWIPPAVTKRTVQEPILTCVEAVGRVLCFHGSDWGGSSIGRAPRSQCGG